MQLDKPRFSLHQGGKVMCYDCMLETIRQKAEVRCGRSCGAVGTMWDDHIHVWAFDQKRAAQAGFRIAADALKNGQTMDEITDLLDFIEGTRNVR